jgi:hypothetical protein
MEKDWRKFVTLNPPNAIKIKENLEEQKGSGVIEIVNKSSDCIIFKVKTTEPKNYVVRPNQGVIGPDSATSVKILCAILLSNVS